MKLATLSVLLNRGIQFVLQTSREYSIDESHALKHAMDVLHTSHQIYKHDVSKYPELESQCDVIYLSSLIHDMCDKKYMDEKEGIERIHSHFIPFLPPEKCAAVEQIIGSMSYSKIRVNGFPTNMGNYNRAFHIVRESDLLAAYDVDRCIIYSMCRENLNYKDAVTRTVALFNKRILKYRAENLFVTPHSQYLSLKYHHKAVKDLYYMRTMHMDLAIDELDPNL
jgi:hypothetical protein